MGDTFAHCAYLHALCAPLALSDETCALYAGDADDFGEYLHATVPANISGYGIRTTNPTRVSEGDFATDQSYLIDTSQGVIHTNLFSEPAYPITLSVLPAGGNNTLLHAVPVIAGSVPVTTTFCYAFQLVAANSPLVSGPHHQSGCSARNVTLSSTVQPTIVNLQAVYTPFPSSGAVAVGGSNYPERASIISVGSMDGNSYIQAITVALRNPNESIALFYGGLGGSYFSPDDDYNWTSVDNANHGGQSVRQLFVALGSLDGNSVIYQYNHYGSSIGSFSAIDVAVNGAAITGATNGIKVTDVTPVAY